MHGSTDGAAPHEGTAADILEIRVHGVSNTPPHRMLGLEADEVVRAAGDDGGSFWVPEPTVLAELRASPDVAQDDFRLPPPGVRREAYSWGALARLSTVPFLSSASGLLSGLVRAFWVLIIPFGLVNAAYWARRLDAGPPSPTDDGPQGPPRDRSLSGALVRLFGWVLTLFWTSTVLSVTVGTVAARCYVRSDASDVVYVCAALPGQMEALARWTPGARTGVLAAAALVAMLGVGLVGLTGAVRFDRRVSASHGRDLAAHGGAHGGVPGGKAPSWPFLARTGLWSHAANGSAAWAYHVASAVALIGLAITVQLLHWGDTGLWPTVVPTVVFGVVVVASAVRISTLQVEAPRARTGWNRWGAWLVLGLTTSVLVAVLVSLTGNPTMNAQTQPWTLVLTTWSVPVLIGLLAVLVVAALALRTAWSASWPVLVVLVGGCAAGGLATGAAAFWWGALGSLAGYGVIGLVAPAPRRADGSPPRRDWRAFEGWGGSGPAVFLSLAAGFALVLAGAVVTGTVAWLGTAAAPERAPDCTPAAAQLCATDTDPLRDPVPIAPPGDQAGTDQAGDGVSPTDSSLPLPRGYDGFSLTSVGAVLALLLSVVAVALTTMVLRPRALPAGPPGDAAQDPWLGATQSTRRLAALAHRAEPLVAILAVALWLAMVTALVVVPFDTTAVEVTGPTERLELTGVALSANLHANARAVGVAAFGLLVTSVVLGGSGTARSRPWGLLWDLTCFLPRVAHPFAAPSYAERTVPELRGRIDDWLGLTERVASGPGTESPPAADVAPDRSGRRVIVSAHSLGGVVAVATVLARQLADGTVRSPERISLLTFGTQLRAFFGRFFPELFGPDVLGTTPCRRARLWAADPWAGEREDGPQTTSLPRSVVGFLSAPTLEPWPAGPRWRSLWRRTDYLGFPVDAYLTGKAATERRIDHRSSEVDPTTYLFTVATHGGDFRTPQYRQQLIELVGLSTPPGASAPTTPAPDADAPPADYTR